MEYGYQHFKRELLLEDMAWRGGPRPGEAMPDFDLPTTDGADCARPISRTSGRCS